MRWLLFICLLLPIAPQAQPSIPDWGDAFLQEEIADVFIEIDPDSLAAAMDPVNAVAETEYSARFVYRASMRDDTVNHVGFRLRGNTSLFAEKKSFKIAFNAFSPGAKWLGMEKLNLIANQNDPSILRAKLCWDTMRRFGLAGSRTSFVRVHINGEFRGIYVNTEHIDENFSERYFGSSSAWLWKCTYPANLAYLGADPSLYKLEAWGRRVYELKNNRQDDYTFLADFIQVLNTTPPAQFECTLPRVFNVQDYLKYLALDILTGNWDGYAYNQNNFYLLRNPSTGIFEYIPYDLDNTLGIDWLGVEWSDRPVYAWGPSGQPRPLVDRILAVPVWRNDFTAYLHDFATDWFHATGIVQYAGSLLQLITEDALDDPYRPLDFGFGDADFLQSITTASGGHVTMSIQDFVESRGSTALQQIDSFSSPETTQHLTALALGENILVRAIGTTSNPPSMVWRPWPGGEWSTLPMEAFEQPAPWNEFAYSGVIPSVFGSSSIEYNAIYHSIEITPDIASCASKVLHLEPAPLQLVINELQAAGNNVIADEFDEFDDWIELYNAGSTPVYLGDKYLTDRPEFWSKWKLPNLTLEPGQFTLFWADGQPWQGFRHLGFSLNQAGETLQLTEVVQRAPRVLDRISFPPVESGHSYGREQDGQLPWVSFDQPTPWASNGVVGVNSRDAVAFRLYPNPVSEALYIHCPHVYFDWLELRDSIGRLIYRHGPFRDHWSIDVSTLTEGIYFISLSSETGYATSQVIVVH